MKMEEDRYVDNTTVDSGLSHHLGLQYVFDVKYNAKAEKLELFQTVSVYRHSTDFLGFDPTGGVRPDGCAVEGSSIWLACLYA